MLTEVITSTIAPWGIKLATPYLHEGSKFATPYEQYVGSKFANPYEQYVDWGNNINFIFIRDQNLPPHMNNMLIGVTTSTLSSYSPEVRRGATSGLQRNNFLAILCDMCEMCVWISIVWSHWGWVAKTVAVCLELLPYPHWKLRSMWCCTLVCMQKIPRSTLTLALQGVWRVRESGDPLLKHWNSCGTWAARADDAGLIKFHIYFGVL